MSFNEFQQQIIEKLNNYFNGSVEITPHNVKKNNGVVFEGIVIGTKEQRVSPTIYLRQFYEEHKQNLDLDEIVKQIIGVYENSKTANLPRLDFFFDYLQVKEIIYYKLINYEKNKEELLNVPHIKYLDMAMVLYCKISTGEYSNGTIQITNEHLKIWNVSKSDVLLQALKNTPCHMEEKVYGMREILLKMRRGMLGDDFTDEEIMEMFPDLPEQSIPMYVLTNSLQLYGASAILYDGVLDCFAQSVQDDLYILPSSIHEVILIPVSEAGSPKDLSYMVREINETQLEPQEVLSDHVYLFSRKLNRTIIAY